MTTDGEVRGLFTQIPFTSTYSGWVCKYDPNATAPVVPPAVETDYTVVCNSHFLTSIEVPAPIIDDSTLINADSWICTVKPVDNSNDTQVIECVNYLPIENDDGYGTGLWRWSPKDGQVEQYGYRQTDSSTAEWVKLGKVTLLEAIGLESCLLFTILAITVQI